VLKASCLTPERLTLYLGNRLAEAEREGAEAHLSDCEGCRNRLVVLYASRAGEDRPPFRASEALKEAARALARPPERARSRRWLAAAAAVVTAALGLATFLELAPPEAPDDALRLDAPGLAAPLALAPADGGAVSAAAIDFRCSAVAGARRYTLTLLDAMGEVVLRETAAQPRWAVDASPAGLNLRPGPTYFWYVAVDLVDGSSAESEVSSFTLTPAE
jgi:hypothetical protein